MLKKNDGATIIAIFFIIMAILYVASAIAAKGDEKNFNKEAEKIKDLPNRYYYNQLNEGYKKYGQQVYNKIFVSREDLKKGRNVGFQYIFSEELEKNEEEGNKYYDTSYFLGVCTCKYENPEMFYVDFSKLGQNDGTKVYIDGISSKEDVEKMELELKEATSQIMSELKNLSSDYLKIKRVHDYLIETIEYTDTKNAHNIYGALVEKKCVCEGYALSFQYFMNELGIDSILVVGRAGVGRGVMSVKDTHAWNYVKLNGNWYVVDTTWDDVENANYKYFLKGRNTIDTDQDHAVAEQVGEWFPIFSDLSMAEYKIVKEEKLTYPTLSTLDYQE